MSDEQRKNLLSGTRDWSGVWDNANYWNADGTHDGFAVMSRKGPWMGLYKQVKLTAGHVYTFSVCVKIEPGQKQSLGLHLTYMNNINDTYLSDSEVDGLYYVEVIGGDWHVISHTFNVTASKYARPRVEATGDFVLSVCAYMLVEGDTPAAWAPADGETLTADAGGENYE